MTEEELDTLAICRARDAVIAWHQAVRAWKASGGKTAAEARATNNRERIARERGYDNER